VGGRPFATGGSSTGSLYGLARAESPDEGEREGSPNAHTWLRASPTRSGRATSKIPSKARQKALRDVVIAFRRRTERAIQMSRYREGEMTHELRDALIELSTVVGVTA